MREAGAIPPPCSLRQAPGLVILRRQAEPRGFRARLAACTNTQLAEDGRDVVVDRLRGEEQPLRDVGVAEAFGDQCQHLDLSNGQTGGILPRRGARPALEATDASLT